mmetsp:Transcript_35504/g.85668  ORF Transcript_35504/g.85668 Transcript_35504/m.85668 type:complete len:88 (-) Transcript_35504:755-1018(-)
MHSPRSGGRHSFNNTKQVPGQVSTNNLQSSIQFPYPLCETRSFFNHAKSSRSTITSLPSSLSEDPLDNDDLDDTISPVNFDGSLIKA